MRAKASGTDQSHSFSSLALPTPGCATRIEVLTQVNGVAAQQHVAGIAQPHERDLTAQGVAGGVEQDHAAVAKHVGSRLCSSLCGWSLSMTDL